MNASPSEQVDDADTKNLPKFSLLGLGYSGRLESPFAAFKKAKARANALVNTANPFIARSLLERSKQWTRRYSVFYPWRNGVWLRGTIVQIYVYTLYKWKVYVLRA
jgi:hypothetical protein